MIKTVLTGIVLCAIATALISSALGAGAKKAVASAGALLTLTVLLSPLRSVRGEDISLAFEAYQAQAASYSGLAEEMSTGLLAEYVEGQAELSGYGCKVSVYRDSSGKIHIDASTEALSPKETESLRGLICRVTGISRENVNVTN